MVFLGIERVFVNRKYVIDGIVSIEFANYIAGQAGDMCHL